MRCECTISPHNSIADKIYLIKWALARWCLVGPTLGVAYGPNLVSSSVKAKFENIALHCSGELLLYRNQYHLKKKKEKKKTFYCWASTTSLIYWKINCYLLPSWIGEGWAPTKLLGSLSLSLSLTVRVFFILSSIFWRTKTSSYKFWNNLIFFFPYKKKVKIVILSRTKGKKKKTNSYPKISMIKKKKIFKTFQNFCYLNSILLSKIFIHSH